MNTTKISAQSAQATIDTGWRAILLFSVTVGVTVLPDMAVAAAGDGGAISTVLCNIVTALTGNTGRAIGTIAIIVVGIGALLGKISWGVALIVAMGVALVFGATNIITALGGTVGGSCSSAVIVNP